MSIVNDRLVCQVDKAKIDPDKIIVHWKLSKAWISIKGEWFSSQKYISDIFNWFASLIQKIEYPVDTCIVQVVVSVDQVASVGPSNSCVGSLHPVELACWSAAGV